MKLFKVVIRVLGTEAGVLEVISNGVLRYGEECYMSAFTRVIESGVAQNGTSIELHYASEDAARENARNICRAINTKAVLVLRAIVTEVQTIGRGA